jgi:hypothetical protein
MGLAPFPWRSWSLGAGLRNEATRLRRTNSYNRDLTKKCLALNRASSSIGVAALADGRDRGTIRRGRRPLSGRDLSSGRTVVRTHRRRDAVHRRGALSSGRTVVRTLCRRDRDPSSGRDLSSGSRSIVGTRASLGDREPCYARRAPRISAAALRPRVGFFGGAGCPFNCETQPAPPKKLRATAAEARAAACDSHEAQIALFENQSEAAVSRDAAPLVAMRALRREAAP